MPSGGHNKINLAGKRFGRYLVLEEIGRNKHRQILWKCICDCGIIKTVCGGSLRSAPEKLEEMRGGLDKWQE